MKFLQNLIKKLLEKPLWLILAVAFLLRVLYLILNYPLWWDAHVYLGMGKFLFSGGKIGMWEPFRPLIHPLLLGIAWKMGLNTIIMGKLLDLLFSLASVYLLYKIAEKAYSKTAAIISSIIFALSPVFIMFTGLLLTEPLAILFGLIGIYFLVKETSAKNYFWGGLFLGLSFLTKFPQGILLAAVAISLLLTKTRPEEQLHSSLLKKLSLLFYLSFGFLIPVMPYLILNYILYQDIFLPFTSGSWIITTATWAYNSEWWYYLYWFFVKNPLYLLFFPALYLFYQKKEWHSPQKSIIIWAALLILAYFWYLPRKEVRYVVLALPFLSLMIGSFINYLYELNREKKIIKPKAFWIAFTIVLLLPLPSNLYFERPPTFEKEIRKIVVEHNITGMVLTSDPAFVSFLDNPIITLDGMEFAPTIYARERGRYKLLFLGDCDLGCPPQDKACYIHKKQFLEQIIQENNPEFTSQYKNCTYMMLTPKT
ncbi:glycosyltransferase family 39 protein [Candidatus Woesearchaeota archaeon]|nr:glycosyltransferase family 39 protein [Candidatus Woesearchaeota archaeon]